MGTWTWKHAALIAGLALVPALGSADPIGPNCGSCNGGTYTLFYSGNPLLDADPLHETYRVTLEASTAGVVPVLGANTFVNAAAIKVSSSVFGASLFSAPGGVANWNLVPGGINAGGCSGSGSGFDCADWVAGGQGAQIGGILDWVFDITVNNGDLITTALGSSIKMQFVDSTGSKVGALLSEEITLQVSSSTSSSSTGGTSGQIPEPSSSGLVVVGLGLIGAGFLARRRANQA